MSESNAENPFEALGLIPPLVAAVASLGYEEPTPIQSAAIPILLAGRDLLGLAATGTGKTAAFALPLLQRLRRDDGPGPFALVLVPTRELAVQVSEAIHRYGREAQVSVLPVYGGSAMSNQLRALSRGVDVVVATPGRALDHLGRGTLKLDSVSLVVLDEADEMLDMGFQEDLEAILSAVPEKRQMALFSATFPDHLKGIARRALREPVRVEVEREELEPGEMPRVRQVAYLVARPHKRAALARVLDLEAPQTALVFCRTRTEVDELAQALEGRGYRAAALHGGLSQVQRDRVMSRLRAGTTDLVIATDVAARGLDIGHLSHVINFDVPSAPEQYVHRIGRTGRAGREGVAITLAEPRERRLLRNIERLTGQPLSLEAVPTLADLRARRLDLVRAQVREAGLAGGLAPYRAVVDALMDELDVLDIAAAAIKALHAASGPQDEDEADEDLPPHGPESRPDPRRNRGRSPQWTRIFISVGRRAGLRPGDLFGAIVGETGLSGQAIGGIQITDRFSIVEVPEEEADHVISALRNATLRGRRPMVARDRNQR